LFYTPYLAILIDKKIHKKTIISVRNNQFLKYFFQKIQTRDTGRSPALVVILKDWRMLIVIFKISFYFVACYRSGDCLEIYGQLNYKTLINKNIYGFKRSF